MAPISSLAETLQFKIRSSMEDPNRNALEIVDLDEGIETFKNRSEGLLNFAKTYRSLNKVTDLNLNNISISELFNNIKNLMKPSLESKNIDLIFRLDNPGLKIEMDTYLIEQVLINLILNAMEACKETDHPEIIISSQKNVSGHRLIKVTDNGTGIPDEIIDDIFIHFSRPKRLEAVLD